MNSGEKSSVAGNSSSVIFYTPVRHKKFPVPARAMQKLRRASLIERIQVLLLEKTIFSVIHDLFIEKHCEFTHLLKKGNCDTEMEVASLVYQPIGLRCCRGPWLESKTLVATNSKYNFLVSLE